MQVLYRPPSSLRVKGSWSRHSILNNVPEDQNYIKRCTEILPLEDAGVSLLELLCLTRKGRKATLMIEERALPIQLAVTRRRGSGYPRSRRNSAKAKMAPEEVRKEVKDCTPEPSWTTQAYKSLK